MQVTKAFDSQSERALSRFDKLMEMSPDMACALDEDGRILQISAASEVILGYHPTEMIGKYLFDFIHPDDKDATLKKAQWLMQGNDIINFENRYLNKSGAVVDLSWISKWDEVDKIRFGFARDITTSKKQAAKLAESEQKYWNLFENSPLPVLLWDLQTSRFVDCNSAAISKYGYSREEFLNLEVQNLWVPGDNELNINYIISSIEHEYLFRATRRHMTKNRDIIWVDLNGQLVIQNGRKMALTMVYDVTEQYYFNELDRLERDLLEKCTQIESNLSEAFDTYFQGLNQLHPDLIYSVLENKNGQLYNISSPGLPPNCLAMINGVPVGENYGPSSLAACQQQSIIIADIQKAPLLSPRFKEAAAEIGIKACMSFPIFGGNGKIIATFSSFSKYERQPTVNEQKVAERVVNILRIILENDRREREIKLSKDRFEKATEATNDVIWEWNLDTNAVIYSDNLKKLFGLEAGVYEDSTAFLKSHVHPDDLEKAFFDINELKYGEALRTTKEFRLRKADGEYAYIRETAVIIRDDQGVGRQIIGATQDITKQRKEEEHLRLLESVATNTTDAVIITEAISYDKDGPRILYVNKAFTEMTGYTAEEMIGKTPGVLQGPRSDKNVIIQAINAVEKGLPFSGSIINYRKNGEEYWKHFSLVPVNNDKGVYSHLIAVERDFTEQKNAEMQQALIAEIGKIFAETEDLQPALQKSLQHLARFGAFSMAEIWLTNTNGTNADLVAKYFTNDGMKAFYEESKYQKAIPLGQAAEFNNVPLPVVFWNHLSDQKLLRYEAAINAGLKSAYIVPLKHENTLAGILVLGSDAEETINHFYIKLFEQFGHHFGALIKRKLVEQQLNQVFNFTPDILCILNIDGYFKRVNPAMCTILEYSEQELLSKPFTEFILPVDRHKTSVELENVVSGHPNYYIENRYVTGSGKIKWLAWTYTGASEQGDIYCAAKDVTEKIELEELLTKANTLARIGSWEVNQVNNSIFLSEIAREILEVESDYQPDTETALNFIHVGHDRDAIYEVMAKAAENGTAGDIEIRIVTAKGHMKWARIIVEAEFSDGICVRTYGSIQDIDTRKKAEIASIQALEEKNTILESIDDVFFAVDENWVITYWNNRAEKILGKSSDDVINKSLWDIYPESINGTSYHKYHQALKTNKVVQYELFNPSIKRWLDITVYPAYKGLSIYMRDITDRKKALTAASEALEERNTILESIGDAFFAVDNNWTVTYWNNTAEQVFSTPRENILNKNLWDLFPQEIDTESYKKYQQALKSNQAVHFDLYFPAINKWREINAYPSANGLSVYLKDVTERKLADLRLLELNQSLEQHTRELAISNAELEQFAYVASHDLQEPLRMVSSFLTQLERKYGDLVGEKGKQYIHFAVDGAIRMREIILDLLEFSKVRKMEENIELVDCNKMTEELLLLFSKQITDTQAEIVFKNLPTFRTYKTPLRQVFQNLISNSLKYHSNTSNPVIKIGFSETKTFYHFTVEDNGIGIAPEYFDKIFIIFQRLHNKDQYSGTGMGLAITKKIVENLGGKIWVESAEGSGSTFHFTIAKESKHKKP